MIIQAQDRGAIDSTVIPSNTNKNKQLEKKDGNLQKSFYDELYTFFF